jgi:hypothetical protein
VCYVEKLWTSLRILYSAQVVFWKGLDYLGNFEVMSAEHLDISIYYVTSSV